MPFWEGEFKLGNRKFNFQVKDHFPAKLTQVFLLVDPVNNLDKLAEDRTDVVKNVLSKAAVMNAKNLRQSVNLYGNSRAKKILELVINKRGKLPYDR